MDEFTKSHLIDWCSRQFFDSNVAFMNYRLIYEFCLEYPEVLEGNDRSWWDILDLAKRNLSNK